MHGAVFSTPICFIESGNFTCCLLWVFENGSVSVFVHKRETLRGGCRELRKQRHHNSCASLNIIRD